MTDTSKPAATREFVINPYLAVRLEGQKTAIYVGGRYFQHCQVLLLNLPIQQMHDQLNYDSIDYLATLYHSHPVRLKTQLISPEEEFWGHCSNLQAWADNDYDTRLLHRNLAFPLLKALTDAGDPQARVAFGREVVARFTTGYPPVVKYLVEEDYYRYLTLADLEALPLDALVALLGTDLYDLHRDFFKHLIEINPSVTMGEKIWSILKSGKFDSHNQHMTTVELEDLLRYKYQIKSLLIRNNQLRALPPSISNLASLERLDLSHNQLRALPASIGNLASLERLDLSYNQLRALPDAIGHLAGLYGLHIGRNQLRDLPDAIGNLSALKILYLNDNQLRALPASVIKLKLRGLSLEGNKEIMLSPAVTNWLNDLRNNGCEVRL